MEARISDVPNPPDMKIGSEFRHCCVRNLFSANQVESGSKTGSSTGQFRALREQNLRLSAMGQAFERDLFWA
jgi:hypothetical protein